MSFQFIQEWISSLFISSDQSSIQPDTIAFRAVCAWQLQVLAFPQQGQLCVAFPSTTKQILRIAHLGRVSPHDLVFKTACTQASRPLASRSFRTNQTPSAPSRLDSCCDSLGRDSSCAARHRLPPLLTRCCSIGTPFSLHCQSQMNLGVMPSSRTDHRTGNETQFLVGLVHDHFYVVLLTRLILRRVSRSLPSSFLCELQHC